MEKDISYLKLLDLHENLFSLLTICKLKKYSINNYLQILRKQNVEMSRNLKRAVILLSKVSRLENFVKL